jgi:hypothetical protein
MNQPLRPFEAATAAAKLAELLSGEEGVDNAKTYDGYMQSQLNPMASQIIKGCLPNGLAVQFPANVRVVSISFLDQDCSMDIMICFCISIILRLLV